MSKRRSPLLSVGLRQTLLGLGIDGLTHSRRLCFERGAEVAAIEQEVVHAAEDTDAHGGCTWRRAAVRRTFLGCCVPLG